LDFGQGKNFDLRLVEIQLVELVPIGLCQLDFDWLELK